MLNLQYVGEVKKYEVSFTYIGDNVVQIEGNFPAKTKGFNLTRINHPGTFVGDYTEYKTIYKQVEGGYQFSNNGTTYPETTPSKPTLEERLSNAENGITELQGDVKAINSALGGTVNE
jgi:hypothetical protein